MDVFILAKTEEEANMKIERVYKQISKNIEHEKLCVVRSANAITICGGGYLFYRSGVIGSV